MLLKFLKIEKEINDLIQKNNINYSRFQNLTDSLKHIRDKTHFHIDKYTVRNPKKVWLDADVKGSELAKGLDDLWQILNYLYKWERR